MNDVEQQQMKQYLSQLRRGLTRMSLTEREEIVQEITAHIRECIAISDAKIGEILARLGAAEELARQYQDGLLLRQADHSRHPFVLMSALWFIAQKGLLGFGAFIVALFGYSVGAVLMLTAILKLFFVHQIGLWVGSGQFNAGFHSSSLAGGNELLGWWYIPVALTAASGLLWMTTWTTREFLSFARRRRQSSFLQMAV